MHNVNLARSFGLVVGAICIITKDKLNHVDDIYDFFVEHNINYKTNSIFYNGRANINRNTIETTPDEYIRFLTNLFDRWYQDESDIVIVNLLQMMALVLKGHGHGSCCNSNCSVKHLTINPDGSCFTCGRTTVDDYFKLGNISNHNFEQVYQDGKFEKFFKRTPDNIDACQKCEVNGSCFGGCMYEAYLEYGTIYAPAPNCAAFIAIYNHIYSKICKDLNKCL
jgi:radical SAM protein with 4Fe4S-binding SPASM domain